MKNPLAQAIPRLRAFALTLAVLCSATLAHANPFASAITNNNGTIQFYLNEGNAFVTVVYEDGSTNASFTGTSATATAGLKSFPLGAHTSFQIICAKQGNGNPFQISSDTGPFGPFNSPRGVDANKNPQFGNLFGRVYVGNSAVSATRDWGIYALTPDLSTNALGRPNIGSFAPAELTNVWKLARAAGSTSGPYRITVAPDNTVYVTDYSTAGGGLWQFDPDLGRNPANVISNVVLGPVGENQGLAAGVHGDCIGVYVSGSIAQGNLSVYTADPALGAPATGILGPGGQGGTPTSPGGFNNVFRYDIGAGPLPYTNAPNYSANLGLPGFQDSQICDVTVGPDGTVFGMFRRANFSDGCLQAFSPVDGSRIYDSLRGPVGSQTDVFQNAYGGVRVSPDGRYIATITINNAILIANLTNGLPDDSSLITIANTPTTGNARGIAWDAADNLYVCSSGQGLLRYFSLGITSTTISSNDFSGTNGSFVLALPQVQASVVATTPVASQNYGSPTPGVFNISLNTNTLITPVTVSFTRSGSAVYSNNLPTGNYTLNLGTNDAGVIISSNSVTFPVGTTTDGNNWNVNVLVTTTPNPVSGPTLSVGLRLSGGATYLAQTPTSDTVYLQNTGPQLLFLTAAAKGASLNRGVPNDAAYFTITRWGDTNGPGNTAASINPTAYTVTAGTYGGTAVFPTDYAARAQRIDPAGDGVVQLPTSGSPGIKINPGDVTITAEIGNPVAHANLANTPTNVTVIFSLTNAASGTNLTSAEGKAYSVTTTPLTITEIDNAVGSEVVLWANPLTSALDSTNWTLTFAATNLAPTTVLPVVLPNYTNGFTSIAGGGTNDFNVTFGYPVALDSIAPSPVMAAKGWTNVLKMTVNKNDNSPAGVNLYPQAAFIGNYALRFNMYLSMYERAINNPFIGTYPREFAAFGINHHGTNCNWRLAAPIAAGTGNSTTNADGVWFAIDAATGSQTPADFDAFTSPALPNAGVTADLVSNTAQSQNGVFKSPQFASEYASGPQAGGEPINQWVDVSVEVTAQTNVSLLINRSQVLTSFPITNGGNYTAGTFMLGYLDPVYDVSDSSAFVYYSNVRVVELSPYIVSQAASLIVTQGATVSFTSSGNYATAPLTNTWYSGLTNPITSLKVDSANSSNLTSTLSLTNVQSGTNYLAVFSDLAGSVTGLVANLEVVAGPANQTVSSGALAKFTVSATGQSAPTAYQWYRNGLALANGNKYAGVTTGTLYITNALSTDVGAYSVAVTNTAGYVIPAATLAVVNPPTSVVVSPAAQTNLWGSTATFFVSASGNTPFSYQWKKAGSNLTDNGRITGSTSNLLTIANLTTADAGSYTVGVTNAAGGAVSSTGVLTITVPAPSFSTVVPDGSGNLTLTFGSTNGFDTTNAFILQSSANVAGPYTNTPATFVPGPAGSFQVTVPPVGVNMFYRLRHAN